MSGKVNPMADPGVFVDKFLQSCGIKKPIQERPFVNGFLRKYKRTAEDFLAGVHKRASGENFDIYPVRNASLAFSNAVLGQYDYERLRAIGIWFIQEKLVGAKILEVGCDSGVLACLLATIFPKAEVTAIDAHAEGIRIAEERARLLGISNVSFSHVRLEDFLQSQGDEKFDLIIGTHVFHEVIDLRAGTETPGDPCRNFDVYSCDDFDSWVQGWMKPSEILQGLSSLLSPEGLFISVDRRDDFGSLLAWIRLGELSGLSISLDSSMILEYESKHYSRKMLSPLTVFSKGGGTGPFAIEILSFHGYKEYLKTLPTTVEDSVVAEMLYTSLDPKETVLTVKLKYRDGSGTGMIYIGNTSSLAFRYETYSTGVRKLVLLPVCALRELLSAFNNIEEDCKSSAQTTVQWQRNSEVLRRIGIKTTGDIPSE